MTPNTVEERTLANAAPSFADQDETTGDDAETTGTTETKVSK